MEIVTGEPAPTVGRDEAVLLLHEMAAVVRTAFGVATRPAGSVPAPVDAAPAPAPAPLAALPVPPLAVPDPPDPEERRSLALLQEIAFLDE